MKKSTGFGDQRSPRSSWQRHSRRILHGDVIIKADNADTTKEFINVIANSGFEYKKHQLT